MALNVQVGHVTCPASTGNQTTNLASGFDPKALILWTSGRTAAGGGSAHGRFSQGFATDRGGTAVQRFLGVATEDNIGTADVYNGGGPGKVIVLTDGTTATVAMSVSFVEFVSGASSAFTLNYATVSSGVLINYIVLGGSDVEDALVGSFQMNTGTQDVTVASGFGQPDLVFFHLSWNGTDPPSTEHGDTWLGWGLKTAGNSGRGVRWGSNDAATTQATHQAIYNNRSLALGYGGALGTGDAAIHLSASSGWPTDGFEYVRDTGTSINFPIPYLALRFSANVTVTDGEATASTSLNGTNTLTSSGTPKLAVVVNTRQTTANTIDTTSTDAAMAGFGAVDGDGNERFALIYDDDGQGTASVAGTSQSSTKAIEYWVPSSNTKDAEADIAVSGSNFVATWTDQAPSAFLYEWLTLGVAVSGTTYEKTGTATADTAASGTSAKGTVYAKTGKATPAARASAADVFEAVEAGAARTAARATGQDSVTVPTAGAATSASRATGQDAATLTRQNTAATTAVASGVSEESAGAVTYEKTGAATSAARATGADAAEHPRTGAASSTARISGPESWTSVETGTVLAAARSLGADVAEHAHAGLAAAAALASGASQEITAQPTIGVNPASLTFNWSL